MTITILTAACFFARKEQAFFWRLHRIQALHLRMTDNQNSFRTFDARQSADHSNIDSKNKFTEMMLS